jgi:hypothetical protein
MSLNGISTLPTKEEKLKAKLDLAQAKRILRNNPRPFYNINLLPTQYNGNFILNNINDGGLVIGRPWISDASTLVDNLLSEDGNNLLTENDNFILVE